MIKQFFSFVLISLICSAGFAADAPSTKVYCMRTDTGSMNVIDTVAFTASAASRTLTVPVTGNWAKLRVGLFLDYTNSGAVTLTQSESMDNGGTYFLPQTCVYTNGSCAANNRTITYTPAADVLKTFEFDVRGDTQFKIVFSEVGDNSTDTISVQACLIAGN
jgi:hypothetical protein